MSTRETLDESGGLVSSAWIAGQLNVTKRQVNRMVGRPGFPEPLAIDGGTENVFLREEFDAWRANMVAVKAKILENVAR